MSAISELCEATSADVSEEDETIGIDSGIGYKFLKASVGFDGTCLKKDTLNLVYISKPLGLTRVDAYW